MYALAQYEVLRRPHEEIGHEAAMARQVGLAHEDSEEGPYVVRDLSWELAQYLDAESFPSSVSAT